MLGLIRYHQQRGPAAVWFSQRHLRIRCNKRRASQNYGMTIRIPLPMLTEERRRSLVKIVKNAAEDGRVAIRNIRRDANTTIKNLLKEKGCSEDDAKGAETEIQKLTDQHIKDVERLLEVKEADLLSM